MIINIALPKILKTLRVMYVEDEENIRKNITATLEVLVKEVYSLPNIETALECFNSFNPDIIISDITLENENGLDLVKKIRQKDKTIPVLILSAHTDVNYLLEATKLKLVEYLIKPLNFEKLEKALFNAVEEIYYTGRLVVSFKNGTKFNIQKLVLFKDNNEINLTPSETALLDLLVKNIGRNISQEEIKNNLWDDSYYTTESAFKSLLNKLRNKIGKDSVINTSGVGYQLDII